MIQITAGFWLLLGWFWLINGWQLLLIILSAAILHELGHCIVLWTAGAHIRCLRISVCGAVLETDGQHLSYGQELAAVLAGPMTNLFSAAALLTGDRPWTTAAAGAHLLLCCFNLLPLRPLDGGKALYLSISWALGPAVAERVASVLSGVTGLLLAAGLVWVMWKSGGSLWLFPAVCGILGTAIRETQ